MDENKVELESARVELPEQKEFAPDKDFEQAVKGAEILENPPDGSFFHGLQLFLAWVQNLVSGSKKTDDD